MRLMHKTLLLGILGSLLAPSRSAATEFATATSYAVGTNPSAVVVADFNGDGKPDIAVVNSGSNNVSILLNNGDGTFQAAKNFDAGNSMTNIFASDFNGDGKLDLAVFLPGNSANSANGEVRILLGNGDGTFQAPLVTSLTVAATTLAVGDLNGDRKADLILSDAGLNSTDITLEILLGKGAGTFQAPDQISVTGLNSAVFAVADLNKDGKPDLAVSVSGGVQVLLGKGDGTFQAAGVLAQGPSVVSILSGDVDGDGNIDLLVTIQPPAPPPPPCNKPNPFAPCPPPPPTPPQQLWFFSGLGDGTFASGVNALLGDCCFVLGDFNADGKPDLADGSLGILLGKGDGAFAPQIPASNTGSPAAVKDLNGDKLDDLVILDSTNNIILVLLNDSPLSGADLGIISAGPSGTNLGQGMNLTYSADVLNEGPEDATNFVLTDTLPGALTFVSATSTAGSCSFSAGLVTCSVSSLVSLADLQISITVTPTATGQITNTMNVSATQPDLAPGNNTAIQTNTVLPTYTLTVGKLGSGSGTVTESGTQPNSSGNGTIDCGSTCSAKFLSGTQVSLYAGADLGSFFTAWGGACSGNGSCTVTMNGDQNVTASFVKGNILSVTLTGGGDGVVEDQDAAIFICTSTNGDCSPSLLPGSTISIQAIPSGSSTFGSWSGACTGTDPNMCSVTMSSNETVTANFNPPPDFSLAATLSNLTVKAGSKVSEVLNFSSQGGFNASIVLACSVSGVAPAPTCNISPNSVPSGSTATLTVDASGVSATTLPKVRVRIPDLSPNIYPVCLTLTALAFLLAILVHPRRLRSLVLAAAMLILGIFPAACGGGSSVSPPRIKNYSVTVTATSGAIQHSALITVTVN